MAYDDFAFEEPMSQLPYGIKPRTIYYQCLRCGTIMTREELMQFSDMMCKNCGGRIFVKLRPPRDIALRRIKAI